MTVGTGDGVGVGVGSGEETGVGSGGTCGTGISAPESGSLGVEHAKHASTTAIANAFFTHPSLRTRSATATLLVQRTCPDRRSPVGTHVSCASRRLALDVPSGVRTRFTIASSDCRVMMVFALVLFASPCQDKEAWRSAVLARSLFSDLGDAEAEWRDDLAFAGDAVPWWGNGPRPDSPPARARAGAVVRMGLRSLGGGHPCGDPDPTHRASLDGQVLFGAATWSDPRLSLEARVFWLRSADGWSVTAAPEREGDPPVTLGEGSLSREMIGAGVRHPWAEVVYGNEDRDGHYLRVGVPMAGLYWDALTGPERREYAMETVEYPIARRWSLAASGEHRSDGLTFTELRTRLGKRDGLSVYGAAASEIEPWGFHSARLGGTIGGSGIHESGLMWVRLGAFAEATLYDGPAGPREQLGMNFGAHLLFGSGPFAIDWRLQAGVNRPDRLRDLPSARARSDVEVSAYVRWTPALRRL